MQDYADTQASIAINLSALPLLILRGQERAKDKEIRYKIAGVEFCLDKQITGLLKVVRWGKDLIDEGVKASPEASMAWCAISLLLPLFMASAETAKTHQDGFYHVTARMEFYVALEDLLFPTNDPPSESVPREAIIYLYKHILEFHFKSVLRFFRGRLKNLGLGLINSEDWTGSLKSIRTIEDNLHRDLNTINNASIRRKLTHVNESTRGIAQQNQALLLLTKAQLHTAIQNGTTLQKVFGLQLDDKLKLPFVANAIYGSDDVCKDPECYDQTRKTIRARLIEWADSTRSSNMIWLNGHAGTGKSTIARTLAKHFYSKDRLAASYFFKRGDKARSDTRRMISTISMQMMTSIEGFKSQFQKSTSVAEMISIEQMDSAIQFQTLVKGPLQALENKNRDTITDNINAVLLFDALDECSNQGDLFRILNLFSSLAELETIRFSIYVISRPTITIEEGMQSLMQRISVHSLCLLDPKYAEESVADIDTYLKESFAVIKNEHRFLKNRTWPNAKDVQKVIDLSTKPHPLFIYASTLVRFVKGRGTNPESRLLNWLKRCESNAGQLDEKLDGMYQLILDQAWSSSAAGGPGLLDEEKDLLVDMLRSIVLLASPLSGEHLSKLLDTSVGNISLLENLSAVISVSNDGTTPITYIHKSFRDYLFRQKTSHDHCFHMNIGETHAMLASKCLKRMQLEQDGLKRDICDLQHPGQCTDHIDVDRLNEAIPSDLKYACLFWVHHLRNSGDRDQNLNDEESRDLSDSIPGLSNDIATFLEQYFLHWQEALSLSGCISDGVSAMNTLSDLLRVDIYNALASAWIADTKQIFLPGSRIAGLAEDASRFISSNRGSFEQAPLQVYVSGLLLSPSGSTVRKQYQADEPDWIVVRPERQAHWGRHIQTLHTYDKFVCWVSFSHDGKMIACVTIDGIGVWDTSSGESRTMIICSSIGSVAFSSSDQQLSSISKDGKLQVWNIASGSCVTAIEASEPEVVATALAVDGEQAAIGLPKGTIKIYGLPHGRCLQTLVGHQYRIYELAFSMNGKKLASSAGDQELRVWDVSSGGSVAFFIGFVPYAFALSPDGGRIAYDYSNVYGHERIVIKDLYNDVVEHDLSGDRGVLRTIQISPNSELVVSGALDGTIRIWTPARGTNISNTNDLLTGHASGVTSIAISQDCQKLVSGARDGTCKVWDISGNMIDPEVESHKASVTSIAVSRGNELLASGSHDGIIKVWDVETASCLHTLEGHYHKHIGKRGKVSDLAFSQDGERLVSCSNVGPPKLWNTQTGSLLRIFEWDHLDCYWDWCIALTLDGRKIASGGGDKIARLWDAEGGDCLRNLNVGASIQEMTFSRDGEKLAVRAKHNYPSEDIDIKVFITTNGACQTYLVESHDVFGSIAILPDGKLAIAMSAKTRPIGPGKAWIRILNLDAHDDTTDFLIDRDVNLRSLHFNFSGSHLMTDAGVISLADLDPSTKSVAFEPNLYSLSPDCKWILWGTQRVFWLPTECRSYRYIIEEGLIALGCSSGQVLIFSFPKDRSPYRKILP